MKRTRDFLLILLLSIKKYDPLHFRTLKKGIQSVKGPEFSELRNTICGYFLRNKIPATKVVEDYLHMINEMRNEMKYFEINHEYRCKNQQEAFDKVYSNPEVMRSYLNALLISQLLWEHHFRMLLFFKKCIQSFFFSMDNVLDLGTGHGMFSKILTEQESNIRNFDVVDISETSLQMAKEVIKSSRIKFHKQDIFDFDPLYKYDFIILGELLEHLNQPLRMLMKVKELLKDEGILWLTVPTNAPAIDHIYLFKSEQEVKDIVEAAGFQVVDSFCIIVEGNTQLIGMFCGK